MKVSTSSTKYLLPALFIVAVVVLLLPGDIFTSGAAKKPIAAAAFQTSNNPGEVGKWSSLIPFKTVPLHISLLPNGKILYWGRDKVTVNQQLQDETGKSNAYVVDPQFFFNNPIANTATYPNTTTNLFCSGHSFLPDGRLLVTGGHEKNSNFPFSEGLGDRSVNIFDYTNPTTPWSRLQTGMALGRWYPYNVTLANGDVAILGGSYWTNRNDTSQEPDSESNPAPEKYTFTPGGQGSVAAYTQDQNPFAAVDVYPLVHLVPDGRIMVTGIGSRLFDPNDPTMAGHFVGYPFGFGGTQPGQSKFNGSSALYDVSNGKILVMGGTPGIGGAPVNGAVAADTSALTDWLPAGTMQFKRKFHTATILPDGKVLVSGGTQCTGGNNITCPEFPLFDSGGAVINPELWSPSSPTTWTKMAESPSKIPRVYHSIALLLPDATVLVGAGGLPGALGEPDAGTVTTSNQFRGYGHPDAEIFSPPYLFDSFGNPAARPVINSVSSTNIGLGQTMQVGFSSATAISSAVLIRLGSVTHGNNQDQRRIPLNFTTSGSTLNVTMPATGKVCPPGPYMLFILNANGTPSVAKIISVGAPQITVPKQPGDQVWVEDSLPAGAIPDGIAEGWNWIGSNPAPFSGALANQSNIVAGVHQHFFYNATNTLTINAGDKLIAYVFIDPANLPSEIMLQWNDGTWEHRAYWGANNITGWGIDGTNSRRFMGPLPPAGQWIRLEVPASLVGLEGRVLNGLAFSMFGGRATWDFAGKNGPIVSGPKNVAAAANGAFATASSTANGNFPAAAAINGDRTGASWGTPSGGWNDNSEGAFSQDWVRVDFNGARTIDEINVYTLRDGYASQSTDPTLAETFNTAFNTGQGATSYDVQYLSGSGWITINCGSTTNPCGRVINNNKVRRQFVFSPVTTSAMRVAVHGSVPWSVGNNFSRLVEVEAYSSIGSTNLALGRPATQSSTLYTTAAAAVDGNRDGNFANASVTHTSPTSQPWWQVDLGSVQNLDTIKLWNRTDCCGDRLSNFYVLVSNNPFTSTDLMTTLGQAGVTGYYTPGQAGTSLTVNVGRTGRYVRVQLAGTNSLSLAEVEVMSAVNLAAGKVASQSSTLYTSAAAAVDGNRDGNFGNASVTHTNSTFQPWWQVDLGVSQSLNTIRLWNRTDCCGDRLSNFYVLVSDNPFVSTDLNTTLNQAGVSSYYTAGQAGPMMSVNVGRTGRYVRVQLAGTNFLSLAEVEVSGSGKLNVAQTVPGSTFPRAVASSTHSAAFPVSAVIDGDRQARNWGNGGGWNDATEGQFGSDWLQVNFAGTKTINRIDVYTLRDNFASQTGDPTLTEIFNTALNSGSGITSFSVQYLNGSSWVDIPNGQVVFNNNVLRRFTFTPLSTSAIRVMVRDAVVWTSIPNNYSRIVEVEAWEP